MVLKIMISHRSLKQMFHGFYPPVTTRFHIYVVERQPLIWRCIKPQHKTLNEGSIVSTLSVYDVIMVHQVSDSPDYDVVMTE